MMNRNHFVCLNTEPLWTRDSRRVTDGDIYQRQFDVSDTRTAYFHLDRTN